MEADAENMTLLADVVKRYQLEEGLEEVAAACVLILKLKNTELDETVLTDAIAAEKIHRQKTTSQNFIAKHWRGDYSLGFAWWAIGISVNVALKLFEKLTDDYFEKIDVAKAGEFERLLHDLGPFCFGLFCLTVFVWHGVGTWRSATRYAARIENKKSYWGAIAKTLILIGYLTGWAAIIKGAG